MAKYLLLLHENPSRYAAMTPAEMGDIIERYTAWSKRLAAEGKLVGGEKLKDDGGRRLQRKAAQVVAADGPYIEAKDVIGGFFMIEAASMKEAESLIQDCPHLSGDNWIELRAIEALD